MENLTALIIEDEEDLATIFSRVLEMAKFKVEIAQTGDIALKRLAVTTPTLVMLDLHLPRVSGVDILRQIRADHRLVETRVVMVTADLLKAEALQGEADLILIKPIRINQLLDAVTRLIQPDML
jgi:two-component system response regulator AdeR